MGIFDQSLLLFRETALRKRTRQKPKRKVDERLLTLGISRISRIIIRIRIIMS